MENTKTSTELLKEKLEQLKINLEKVGRKALKEKYAKAYQKILNEINELSNEVIRENVMFLDLSCCEQEALPKFIDIVTKHYGNAKKFLLDGNFDEYIKVIDTMAEEYTKTWCEHVVRAHVVGMYYVFNPFTQEKLYVNNNSESSPSEADSSEVKPALIAS